MKNYKLHYADLDLNLDENDIPIYEFETFKELVNFVFEKSKKNRNKAVFLISKDYESTCPFITDNKFDIEFILEKMPGMGFKSDTFIFEVESFEDAYKIALTMVEEKKLCYNN
jgi:hypothetical protein